MMELSYREWLKLRAEFQKLIPPRCRYPEHIERADPECHGYHEKYAWARYRVQHRKWAE